MPKNRRKNNTGYQTEQHQIWGGPGLPSDASKKFIAFFWKNFIPCGRQDLFLVSLLCLTEVESLSLSCTVVKREWEKSPTFNKVKLALVLSIGHQPYQKLGVCTSLYGRTGLRTLIKTDLRTGTKA